MISARGMNLPVSAVCSMLSSDFSWNYNELAGGEPLKVLGGRGGWDAARDTHLSQKISGNRSREP